MLQLSLYSRSFTNPLGRNEIEENSYMLRLLLNHYSAHQILIVAVIDSSMNYLFEIFSSVTIELNKKSLKSMLVVRSG